MESVLAELREHLEMRAAPESVELVGQRFAVEVAADSRHLGGDRMGQCRIAEQRILIRAELGADQARDTLLHEILHGLLDVAGLMRDEDEREESIVHALSPLLLDALRRNPRLVSYLVADS